MLREKWTLPGGLSCKFSVRTTGEDSARTVIFVKAPKGMRQRDVESHLRDSIDRSCHHSHDCCGHWYAHVRSVVGKGRKFRAIISEYQNI